MVAAAAFSLDDPDDLTPVLLAERQSGTGAAIRDGSFHRLAFRLFIVACVRKRPEYRKPVQTWILMRKNAPTVRYAYPIESISSSGSHTSVVDPDPDPRSL